MLGRRLLGLAGLLMLGCVHARDAATLDERDRAVFCSKASQPAGEALTAIIGYGSCLPHRGPVVSMGGVVALEPSWTSELTVDGEGKVVEVHRVTVLAAHEDRARAKSCLERALEGRRVVPGIGQSVRFNGTGGPADTFRPDVCRPVDP